MSSILKALRRLEEERARQGAASPEISASLLRRGVQRRALPLWIWPAVLTLLALTILLFVWWSSSPRLPLRAAAPVPPMQEIAPPSRGSNKKGVIIEEVIDQRRPLLSPPPAPLLSAPDPLLSAPAPRVAPKTLALPLLPAKEKATIAPSPDIAPSPVIAPQPEERQHPVVSAIAWQEEQTARMAVVDGLPVMTGEVVGSATVQEIEPDRILFREGEKLFIVRMPAP